MATSKRTQNTSARKSKFSPTPTESTPVATESNPAAAVFADMARRYRMSANLADRLAEEFAKDPKAAGASVAWTVAILLGRAFESSDGLATLLNRIASTNEPGMTAADAVRDAWRTAASESKRA